jgi:uroporphyrin-3 C-methyltransferase
MLVWLLLLAALTALGWQAWKQRQAHERARVDEATQQWQSLESRIDALRLDQRAQAQRLQQADATNRLLREDLLGVDQRAALLEQSVRQLGDPERHGVEALRIDEAALLLGQGEQRLRLAGDLDGARRAYALAADTLAGVDNTPLDASGLLNARQSLVQERAALDALGADPRSLATARLETFAATLAGPPLPDASVQSEPWWRRGLSRLVSVSPTNRATALPGANRAAAFAGLQLELTLARAAAERRDSAGFRAALAHADGWLIRLWPDSAALRQRRAQLHALQQQPLVLNLPTLGSTRQQLLALASGH